MNRLIVFSVLAGLSSAAFAEGEEAKITFDDHIKPILREHCTACHSQGDKSSGLALDSYSELMAGGSSGDVVASGRPDASRLYALVIHQQQPFMPPDEDPIDKAKLDLIKTWIEQGMPENAGSKIKKASQAASSMLGSVSTGKPEGPPPMPERILRQPVVESDRSAAIAAMAASPWAPLVAIGGQEQVILTHAENGQLLGIIPFPEGEPQSLTFTRDGKQLLIGGGHHGHSGCAVLVDVATGDRISKVGDELDIVLAADISPDKQQIAIAGPGRIVRVYDSLTGSLIRELKKHTDWIYCLRYSPDGVLLASGDRSNGLVLWEADSGNLYGDLPGHKGSVTSIDFRSDSNVMVSASLDGTLKLWDLNEVKEIRSWAAHEGGTNDAQYSHEGFIASAGKDGKIKLWNGNGELQREFSGLTESALRVCMTGDASIIAGGDWNGRAQLWQKENPDHTLMVAANPPSVERRLELATQALTSAEADLTAAAESARIANEENAAVEKLLTEQRQAAQEVTAQLADATAKETSLQTSIGEHDQRILALEKELAELRSKRQSLASELEGTLPVVQSLTVRQNEVQQAVVQTEEKAQQARTSAESANQALVQVQQRQTQAQAEVQQAQADQQAIQQRAAELEELSRQAAAQAREISERVALALQQEQSHTENVDKLTIELDALRERLATLQKRIDEIGSTKESASQQLDSAKAATNQLRDQAAQAEQSAVEIQERLKLFQQSYNKAL